MNRLVSEDTVLRTPPYIWGVFVIATLLLLYVFREGLSMMVGKWELPEYNYAYFIPLITAFLVWQKKNILGRIEFNGSWLGVLLALLGVLLFFVAKLSALHILMQYGFLLVLGGLILSYSGSAAFKMMVVPLLFLLFMVPIPEFAFQNLSNRLQLISSEVGVAVIRLFDISVHLEGNVIDLGVYKLQVVEACSGLRYLFPLLTLGFLAAYFFKVNIWKRAVIFLSTIPITVFMNSVRIGAIGILVEYWGVSMAEGFLHYFEGWVVFMLCLGTLLGEMWVILKLSGDNRPLAQVFGLEFPDTIPPSVKRMSRRITTPLIANVIVIVAIAVAVPMLPERKDVIPERKVFSEFSLGFGEWTGRSSRMESIYVDALNFDDYLMADFNDKGNRHSVNVYVGYYATQRADKVPHSPRACLPGGGWVISDLTNKRLNDISVGGTPLQVNRVVIKNGEYTQLVYYWFQQRNRVVTSELLVKWYLLVDSIVSRRTDGALVRLITMVSPDEDMEAGDKRLTEFAKLFVPTLLDYVPD